MSRDVPHPAGRFVYPGFALIDMDSAPYGG